MRKSSESMSGVGVHMGAILLRAASTYPTLLEVIMEQIQNAIDADSKDIWVNINQKSRTISIRDNGNGANQATFEEALSTVGRTIKPQDKLGRFGLGLCSPLGKCEKHTFTSTERTNPNGYIEWTFETPKIADMKEVRVPLRTRPEMWFGNVRGRGAVSNNWRTQVLMENYTTDRFLGKLTMDSLCEGVLKYNQSMKRKGVVVHITLVDHEGKRKMQDIRAKDFQGLSLEVATIDAPDAGKTEFRLYVAKATAKGRAGKVWVGESGNDFRIAFGTFLRSLSEVARLSDETTEALTSGFFEGEILNPKVQLHANRRGFELNDALLGFCIAIEEWFQKFGREHYEKLSKARTEERYQDIGIRSMRVLEALSKSPLGQHILKAIDSFKVGTIGEGHFPRRGTLADKLGIAVTGKPAGNLPGEGKSNEPPVSENREHRPFVVHGPQGNERKVVRSGSLGLSLAHEPLPGDKLWDLDVQTGTITLNIKHPQWVTCAERGDRVLMKFQEYLMINALTLHILPEDWREIAGTQINEATPLYVFTLIHGDVISGRIPNPRQSEKDANSKPSAGKLVLKAK